MAKISYKVEVWQRRTDGKKGPLITTVATYYIERIAIKRADVERAKAKNAGALIVVAACTPKYGSGLHYMSCEHIYTVQA